MNNRLLVGIFWALILEACVLAVVVLVVMAWR